MRSVVKRVLARHRCQRCVLQAHEKVDEPMSDSTSLNETSTSGPANWLPFVLPLALYLLLGFFEPKFTADAPANITAQQSVQVVGNDNSLLNYEVSEVRRYVALTVVKLFFVGAILAFYWRVYQQHFALATDGLAWAVGVSGAVLWIGLCALASEPRLVAWAGVDSSVLGQRSQFNPFQQIDSTIWRGFFIAARFGLLVIIVPLAEELFLRGFLMRAVHSGQWLKVRFKDIGWAGLVCGTGYGVLTHPNEAVAALVWFSLLSWLMLRTGKFWNCVVAHAVTNGLLGLYVVRYGQWQLW